MKPETAAGAKRKRRKVESFMIRIYYEHGQDMKVIFVQRKDDLLLSRLLLLTKMDRFMRTVIFRPMVMEEEARAADADGDEACE